MDISKCDNVECKLKNDCLRFFLGKKSNDESFNSFISYPEEDCVNNNHELFINMFYDKEKK